MTTLAVLVGSTVTGGTDIGIAGAFSSAIGGTDDDIRLVGLDAVAAVMLSDKRPGESPPDLPEGPRRSQGGRLRKLKEARYRPKIRSRLS